MSDVTERLTKGEENDYHPVNQYIDEQSKLRSCLLYTSDAADES